MVEQRILEITNPFYLKLDVTKRIVACGSLMAKTQERDLTGLLFFDAFQGQMMWVDAFDVAVQSGKSGLWFFQSREFKHSFRSTVHAMDDGSFLLLNNPVINQMTTVGDFHLILADIPSHDSLFELVFFQQASITALDDALKLNTKLEQKNKALQVTGDKLSEVNGELVSLLSTVHHKVKNNLTLISGILEMKKSRLADRVMIDILQDIQSRVRAVSKVHETMHKTGTFGRIRLKSFTEDLIHSTFTQNAVSNNVQLLTDLEDIIIDGVRGVYYGLLLNELVTNCIRHAFPLAESPFLEVRLKADHDMIYLVVRDNGRGLDQASNATGMGFMLIDLLVRQLKGFHSTYNNDGLEVSVQIPANEIMS